MLQEKWTDDVPDTWPDIWPAGQTEPGPDIKGLHIALRKRTRDMQKRRQELFDKYGVMLNIDEWGPKLRLVLMIQHGFGILTENRLQFELAYIDSLNDNITASIERAEAMIRRQKESKTLHLPDGRTIEVPPTPEDNGGTASDHAT